MKVLAACKSALVNERKFGSYLCGQPILAETEGEVAARLVQLTDLAHPVPALFNLVVKDLLGQYDPEKYAEREIKFVQVVTRKEEFTFLCVGNSPVYIYIKQTDKQYRLDNDKWVEVY